MLPVAGGGVGVTTGDAVRTGVGVGVTVLGVAVRAAVGVRTAVGVRAGVAVRTGVAVGIAVRTGVGVTPVPVPKVNVMELPMAPTLLIFKPEAAPLHQLELGVVVLSNKVLFPE